MQDICIILDYYGITIHLSYRDYVFGGVREIHVYCFRFDIERNTPSYFVCDVAK